jgi:hypothetical protein
VPLEFFFLKKKCARLFNEQHNMITCNKNNHRKKKKRERTITMMFMNNTSSYCFILTFTTIVLMIITLSGAVILPISATDEQRRDENKIGQRQQQRRRSSNSKSSSSTQSNSNHDHDQQGEETRNEKRKRIQEREDKYREEELIRKERERAEEFLLDAEDFPEADFENVNDDEEVKKNVARAETTSSSKEEDDNNSNNNNDDIDSNDDNENLVKKKKTVRSSPLVHHELGLGSSSSSSSLDIGVDNERVERKKVSDDDEVIVVSERKKASLAANVKEEENVISSPPVKESSVAKAKKRTTTIKEQTSSSKTTSNNDEKEEKKTMKVENEEPKSIIKNIIEEEEQTTKMVEEKKADAKMSTYDALLKEDEEEEERVEKEKIIKLEEEEKEMNKAKVKKEEETASIITINEEIEEETKKENILVGGGEGKHEIDDPLYRGDMETKSTNEEKKDDEMIEEDSDNEETTTIVVEKQQEEIKKEEALQEANALSMDFGSTTTIAPDSDKVDDGKVLEKEEESNVAAEAPIESSETETEEKDWEKSKGVYEAILEADKSDKTTMTEAIVEAAENNDDKKSVDQKKIESTANAATTTIATTTTTTTTTTDASIITPASTGKVFGGPPKSLGVVSASPLTNPSLSFAAYRFAKRLGKAFARPGKCICAGSCECAGACGSSSDSLEKQSLALKDAGIDVGISVISDPSLVYNEHLNLERWIGEVADPAIYGLTRLYAAVEYFISTDLEDENATFYAIMNKSPFPELANCDVFDAMFEQMREDKRSGKTVNVNKDAKDEAKLAVLTACAGFVNNPQATKFGGGKSAKEILKRFDAIIPADRGLDGLISLTFMSGFALSDLAYGANENENVAVDLNSEPDAVLKRLRDSNEVDAALYKQATKWLDDVKSSHMKAFNAHKAIVEVWIDESDEYCKAPDSTCATALEEGGENYDQFAGLLGSFPESCKASDPKTRSCVDEWWQCQGPGSEGSAFAGHFSSSSSASSTTTLDGSNNNNNNFGNGNGRKNVPSAVEALSNFKYKVMYDREHPLNKAAQFGAHHSKRFAKGTIDAAKFGAGHAVRNFKKIPPIVNFALIAMFVLSMFGYYTYVQYKALQPMSSLELNTMSVKVLKSFGDREKALKGISSIPAGELMRDDAFWGAGLSQMEKAQGTAGRGSSRATRGKRRNNRGADRGPMTEEELNFYDDDSD